MVHVLEGSRDPLSKADKHVANLGNEVRLLLSFLSLRHTITSLSLGSAPRLSGFLVTGVLLAEAAVLVHLEAVGIVLFVLHGIVVALLALRAGQRNLDALIRCQLRHLPSYYCAPRISAAAAPPANLLATKTAAHSRGRLIYYRVFSPKLQ